MLTTAVTAFLPSITTLTKAISFTALGMVLLPKPEIEASKYNLREMLTVGLCYSKMLEMDKNNKFIFKELNIDRLIFTKFVGAEFSDGNPDRNQFKNNILIESVAFQNLRLLNNILDNCDFKSNKELTKNTLSYRDINGLNFLNHVFRNRGAIGNSLSNKIIDIYVENLDKKTLLESLDNFVLTLPPEQFKKIADKVGVENLQKFNHKINAKKIKKTISKYHSPDILFKKNYQGYEKTTLLMNSFESNPLVLKELIKRGYGVQITPEIEEEFKKIGFSIKGKSGVYVTSGNTFSGKLPDTQTYNMLSDEIKTEMLKHYENETVLSNFLKNLKANQKHLAQQKTSFSSSRASDSPSAKPLSPQSLSEGSQKREL